MTFPQNLPPAARAPRSSPTPGETDSARMAPNAARASTFLKAISHGGRLAILCHLVTGEKSVAELERLLCTRQAAVSQQLSKLRLEGLVTPRRDGKTIYYSLADDRSARMIAGLSALFCPREAS